MAKSEFLRQLDAARARGHRYFSFKGKMYNTQVKGESAESWAKKFKDNSKYTGSSRVGQKNGQSLSVASGWDGHKGANDGYYDDKGKWVLIKGESKMKGVAKSSDPSTRTVNGKTQRKVKAGNNYYWIEDQKATNILRADVDSDEITKTSKGGTKKVNSRTGSKGVTIGEKEDTSKAKPGSMADNRKTNSEVNRLADLFANTTAAGEDFLDAMPFGSGFNLPKYAKNFSVMVDAAKAGDWDKLGLTALDTGIRGVEAATTLYGGPMIEGAGRVVAAGAGKVASKVFPKGVTIATNAMTPTGMIPGEQAIIRLLPKTAAEGSTKVLQGTAPSTINKFALNAVSKPLGEVVPQVGKGTVELGRYSTPYATGSLAGNYGVLNIGTGLTYYNMSNAATPGMTEAVIGLVPTYFANLETAERNINNK